MCCHGGREDLFGYLWRPPGLAAPLPFTVLPRVRPQLGSAVAVLAHRCHLRGVAGGLRALHPVRGKGRPAQVLGLTRGSRRVGTPWIRDAISRQNCPPSPRSLCFWTFYRSGPLAMLIHRTYLLRELSASSCHHSLQGTTANG